MDVKNLFKIATDKKASDLHLLVGQPPIIRVDGSLVTVSSVSDDKTYGPLTAADLVAVTDLLLDEEQKARLLIEKDLDCSYGLDNTRFRINVSYEKDNLCVVARVIEEKKPTLEELGMPAVVKQLLDSPQ